MRIRDQIGHHLELGKVPERIVSLVPSQTELLCYLGLEESMVGVTGFCTHPKGIRSRVSTVGGTKDPDLQLIESLNPDLIICNKEENRQEDVRAFQKKYATYTSDVITLEDALSMINDIGALTNKHEKSEALVETIRSQFVTLSRTETKKVAYFIWKDPLMVVCGNTFINHLLQRIGLENAFEDKPVRYAEIDPKELESNEVDLIMLSSEPYPFKEKNKIDYEQQFPGIEVVLVDGRFFSWYGSCLVETPAYLDGLLR